MRRRKSLTPRLEAMEERALMSTGVIPMQTLSMGNPPPVAYVRELYQAFLNTPNPDTPGLQYWVNNVNSGKSSAWMAQQFESVNPSANLTQCENLANSVFVTSLYGDILGRPGDSGGFTTWVNILNTNSLTLNQAALSFWNSSEHLNELNANTGNIGYYGSTVYNCYTDLLQRNPDAAGLTNWVNGEFMVNLTSDQIATGFANSQEFASHVASMNNSVFIQSLYDNILHRNGTTGDISSWTTSLNSGLSRSSAAVMFWDSKEHYDPAMAMSMPTVVTDHPWTNGYGFYSKVNGSLWDSSGPKATDVQQNSIGDCWFLASISEVAAKNPNAIKTAITDLGPAFEDGQSVEMYKVRLYDGTGTAHYIIVDNMFPFNNGNSISVGDTPSSRALWPALMEKAYEVAAQTHIVISMASVTATLSNSVYDLNNGYADWGLLAVSGHGTSSFEMDTARLNTCINTSTYYVTMSTNETVPAGSWFVPAHEYVAISLRWE